MNQEKTRSAKHLVKQTKKEMLIKALPLLVLGFIITPAVGLLETAQVAQVEAQAAEVAPDRQALIDQFGTSAQKAAADKDLYASVMVAQALLETGFGSSGLSQAPYYNLFGVKEYGNDPAVQMATKEYLNGQWTTENASFAAYNSYEESFVDHADLLHTEAYKTSWKSQAADYQTAANALTGHYATDPDYGTKLISMIETYDLARFDNAPATTTPAPAQPAKVEAPATYTVKTGDTLSQIAKEKNLSVEQLIEKNQLSDHVIFAGQTLNF